MRSVREAIVAAVMGKLVAAVTPVAVLRQPTVALPRERMPALVIVVESDQAVQRSSDRMERTLVLRMTALARDPVSGYAVADDLICQAHAALLADQTLGGLALGITEGEADWQAEDADIDAIALPVVYHITYRTHVSDITQGG